jgi:predicted phage replisome organizer
MGETKYFWLKLKRDFFKRHDIRIIEEMPNGKEYILFYLKLLLESIDHEGALRFSDTVPYNEQMLSVITNTNIDVVRSAMKMFSNLKMIDILDDETIYMAEVKKLTGSETKWAEKKRIQREKEDNVPRLSSKCPTEKEIRDKSKETNKETNKELQLRILEREEKEKKEKAVADLYKEFCPSLPPLEIISTTIKETLNNSLNEYTLEQFETVFRKASASTFLCGKNERKWVATFDWLVQSDNMAKVLNGKYDDRSVMYVGKNTEDGAPAMVIAEDKEREERMRIKVEELKKRVGLGEG